MPGDQHEARVAILNALGLMAGFSRRVVRLPDHSLPDVVRFDPSCGSMFIGEAKDSETAGRAETRDRLLRYLEFFELRLDLGLRGSVFALCVGEDAVARWAVTLEQIATCVHAAPYRVEVWPVPEGVVLWLRVDEVRRQRRLGRLTAMGKNRNAA